MKPRDIFTLAVRLVGLLFLYRAAIGAVDALDFVFWGTSNGVSVLHGLSLLITNALAATWFIFGAWPFSRWAYPPSKTSD